jgi:RNA polymerase sigma-70 factor, ECF subfamily
MSDETSEPKTPTPNAPAEIAAARSATNKTGTPPLEDEALLLAALRRGDEDAFMRLVEAYHPALLRLARMYVSSREVAEEVVQETWLGVLRGLDRFEGRSSLKTWIYHILANTAKTRAAREGRSVPFSSLAEAEAESGESAVEPERFQSAEGTYPGGWMSFPQSWDDLPEQRLLSGETMARIGEAIQSLPEGQRMVITLRDVDGCSSEEACNVLGISETNQRVLLHRARARVRRALERYLDGSR